MTGFRKLSLLAATAVVLTACSPGGPPRDGTAVVGDDPRVVVHDLSFGPDMLLVLTLEYVPEHGCLLVRTIDAETGEPGEVLTPIWPSDVEPLNTGGQAGVTVPEVGELVGTGAPIMHITDLNDMWVTFSIREDLLANVQIGTELNAFIPALGDRPVKLKVYYMKDRGTYAAWKATKTNGQYDAKTFEVRARAAEAIPGLRPGMSVILKKKGNEIL